MLVNFLNQCGSVSRGVQNVFNEIYSLNLPVVVNTINQIAIPAIALFVLSNIPEASAGPIAYATCISGCELAFTQAGVVMAPATAGWSLIALFSGPLGCPIICGPALAAPTP